MINLSIVKLMLTTPIHLLKVITMKNVKNLIAAAVLSSLSFASFAAVEVQATPEGQQKFGDHFREWRHESGLAGRSAGAKSAGDGGEVFPYYLCYRPEYPSRYGGNL